MAASITVRRSIPPYEARDVQSYDMDLEVLSAVDMDKAIFVFQVGVAPARSPGQEMTDYFVSIADPVDMEELATIPPNPADDTPFYRSDKVSLRFRDITSLEECWTFVSSDITGLVAALNAGVGGGSSTDVTFN